MYKKNDDRNSFFNIQVTLHGKGGHSSVPSLTRNPIPVAFKLIQIINGKLLFEFGSFQNVALFPVEFNAGTQQNIIPDDAFIKFRGESSTVEDRIHLLEILDTTVKALGNLYQLETRVVYENK